jgi:dTDP-4-dehydrorhamnose 3,5-epimerase
MHIQPLRLPGTYEITLAPRKDDRGYFMRVYDETIFRDHGLQTTWVQENQSRSTRKHTVRGLHFQAPPHAETKLVRVTRGAIFDVFVDLRRQSDTYGQWDAVELTEEKHNMVYIPKGFAHGFCSLTEDVIVIYRVDAYYAPAAEGGLFWQDPDVGIQWPTTDVSLSEKDSKQPLLRDLASPFV